MARFDALWIYGPAIVAVFMGYRLFGSDWALLLGSLLLFYTQFWLILERSRRH